jgi:succinate-semialdehyde dehydrogenase/glutarate-semialdehyde dehydrogenase
VEHALATADTTFTRSWSTASFSDRAAIVGRAAALMRDRKEQLARLATVEMGKRIAESRDEVDLSAAILAHYSDHAEKLLAPRAIATTTGAAHIENSPLGVLLGVQPWNFPYYQLARFAAPNLMAGNVLLVKHASSVPQCALAFEQLFTDAGAPHGTYTNLFVTIDQVGAIIDDPRVKGIALTGSEQAGEALASRAGKNLKRSTMELGGSDAFIVLEDCDLDYAVRMAVLGRIGNTGQTCIGAKRFIVVGQRADQFLSAFRDALSQLQPGDPLDEATTLAPLASETALNHLLEQVRDAVAHGARLFEGGGRIARRGAFMQPTILTDVTTDNPAFRQEFFGPVSLFFPAKDEDDAIAIANNSPFGLGGSVYTSDIEHGKQVAGRIETGMVFVNYPFVSAPELPFGGIKRSGYGKELSDAGIQEFVNRKLICVPGPSAPLTPRQVAEAWFSHLGCGNLQGAQALLDENVRWENIPMTQGVSDLAPWLGSYQGVAAVLKSVEVWASYARLLSFRLLKLVIDGQEAVGMVHERAQCLANNNAYGVDVATSLHIDGGKITHYRVYWDSAPLIKAFRNT